MSSLVKLKIIKALAKKIKIEVKIFIKRVLILAKIINNLMNKFNKKSTQLYK
jgi:hypothetical protein